MPNNDDTVTILTALSDFRQEAAEAIGQLHQEFSEFKGNMDARVKAVEDDQDKTERRQWIHSVIVLAGGIVHHDLGRWLNLKF